jgi:predicted Ser/Thr protein kinase
MGRGRAIAIAWAPSADSVVELETLSANPFAKNSDFADAVCGCLASTPACDNEADGLMGRAGYAIVGRLLEVYAGAAPGGTQGESPERSSFIAAALKYVEQAAAPTPHSRSAAIPTLVDALLSLAPIQSEFKDHYDLPEELDLTSARLYRTGTTSAIFRCRWGGPTDVALKVTLSRYLGLDALSKASESYGAEFRAPPEISPEVYRCASRFIVLGFVEGKTLEERFADITGPTGDKRPAQERVDQAFEALLAMTRALDRLATYEGGESAHHHLDLTPNNVIVPKGRPVSELKLIDFGRNKLLVEPIAASSAAITRAAHYVAPEIRGGSLGSSAAARAAADAYSVGLLALETFSPGESKSRNDKIEELWERSPGLAMILEDLLIEDAKHRLMLVPDEFRDMPFAYLINRIELERAVEHEFGMELVPRGRIGNALRLFGRFGQIARMYKVSNKFAERRGDYRRYRGLALWNALAMLCWLSIWVVVLGLVLFQIGKGLHVGWLQGRGNELGEWLFQEFKHEDYPADFWGREIAFSFGLMAFTYYTNIYATVWFPATGGRHLARRARIASAMARSLAFVTPAPCIVGALFAPRIWPWVTIFGVCWAAASNWAMANLHHDVWKAAKEGIGADIDPTKATRHVFYEWALQMTTYGGGVTIIALALHFLKHSRAFPVDDVGAYVTVLTFLNLFFIVRLNCIQEAPKMRGLLQRTAFHLTRLSLAAARPPASSSVPVDDMERLTY